jgi:4a-hydroxytetrahydrobiopterin dehydratase
MDLAEEECHPVAATTPPLSRPEAEKLAQEIPQWTLKEGVIEREFTLDDFEEAMEFVNGVAEIAQEQDHHPDIYIAYNQVRLEFSTHKVGGLSRNDFIMAAKVNELA